MKLIKKIKNRYFRIFLFFLFISLSLLSKKFSFSNQNSDNLRQNLVKDNAIKCVMFTPKHNIKQTICDLIKNEKKKIKAAIYILTDRIIAQELIEAKSRNVEIEIVTCCSNIENEYNKIWLLNKSGIQVYIFDLPKKIVKNSKFNAGRLMHHKFFIFEQNIDDKSILINGSFNCTVSAQRNNRENVVILDDKNIIEQFNNEFNDLKEISRNISNYIHKKPVIEKNEPENLNLKIVKKFWDVF